jgi:hypothetical protein
LSQGECLDAAGITRPDGTWVASSDESLPLPNMLVKESFAVVRPVCGETAIDLRSRDTLPAIRHIDSWTDIWGLKSLE